MCAALFGLRQCVRWPLSQELASLRCSSRALVCVDSGHSSSGSTKASPQHAATFAVLISGIVSGGVSCSRSSEEGARCAQKTNTPQKPLLVPKDLQHLTEPSETNKAPVLVPPPFPGFAKQQWSERWVAPMVGLPCCGKTYIAKELKRYIEFFHGSRAAIFDLEDFLGPDGDKELHDALAKFFEAAEDSVRYDAYGFDQRVDENVGGFAIIRGGDSVESTKSKWSAHNKVNRRGMVETLEKLRAQVCFIQVSIDEPAGDKYVADLARHRGKSVPEFNAMIARYEDHYVPISLRGKERDTPSIRLINYNQSCVVNQLLQTFIGSEICHFLANLHPYQHSVYLSRHGESEFNVEKRLGGDSGLSPRGKEYARRLAIFSEFVITGNAIGLVCVTLTAAELKELPSKLTRSPGCLLSKGDWSGYGDTSKGVMSDGMQLVKIQDGYGTDFYEAPRSVDQILECKSHVVTLAFVKGDATGRGQVPARLWTSSLRRTKETAEFIAHPIVNHNGKPFAQMRGRQFRNLDEVYAGEYDGMTEAEIEKIAPEVIDARRNDKLGFRYPRGESYYDIIARLDAVISHLERIRDPVLLVSHQAVLRLIYGWLKEQPREATTSVSIPQHEVILVLYDGLGGPRVETRHPLGPDKLADDGQQNL